MSWFLNSVRVSRSGRFKLSVRSSTSTIDISWQERRRLHLWCSSENAQTPFPGLCIQIIFELHIKYLISSIFCYQAHDHAIKCLAMDPNEEIFVTGSADGDIKVHLLLVSKPNGRKQCFEPSQTSLTLVKIWNLIFIHFRLGMGVRSANEFAAVLLPGWTQTQQLFQAYGSRCDANSNRSARSDVLVWSRRKHESSIVAWARYDC